MSSARARLARFLLRSSATWRGVDGFRVDVMHHLVKDCDFRDNPPNPHFRPGMSPYRELLTTYSADLPEVQEIVAMMRGVIEEDDDRRLVVVLNLGAKSQSFNLADLESDAILLLSTRLDRTRENLGDTLELRGDEGVIIELA